MTFVSGLPLSRPEIASDASEREKRSRMAATRLSACTSGQRYNRRATEEDRRRDLRILGELDEPSESR